MFIKDCRNVFRRDAHHDLIVDFDRDSIMRAFSEAEGGFEGYFILKAAFFDFFANSLGDVIGAFKMAARANANRDVHHL